MTFFNLKSLGKEIPSPRVVSNLMVRKIATTLGKKNQECINYYIIYVCCHIVLCFLTISSLLSA